MQRLAAAETPSAAHSNALTGTLKRGFLKKLSALLQRLSLGSVVLLATLIFIVFTATVLPRQSAAAEANGAGAATPDLSFFYTPTELVRMAEAYGVDGRQAYVRARFTFDVAWPLVYTFFLVTTTSWLFRRGFPAESRWQFANLVPLLAALFDFLENMTTSWVMLRFPDQAPLAGILASLATPLKWIFVGGSFLLLVVGIVAAIVTAIRRGQPGE